ncbi:MAG: 2-oxoglutarate dehydrogenase E1 component [Burkholderiaceae bacterium]
MSIKANVKVVREIPLVDQVEAAREARPLDPAEAAHLVASYREHGYLQAAINPLAPARDEDEPAMPRGFRHAAPAAGEDLRSLEQRLRRSYCGGLALNATHVRSHAQLEWLYARVEAAALEPRPAAGARLAIYGQLFAAERLEHAIAAAWPQAKRFSLEGCESYVVFLHATIEAAAAADASRVVMGMPHRGRVNVLANVMGLDADEVRSLYTESPAPHLAAWDIKEHLGLTRRLRTAAGAVDVTLAHNPSHLESVVPVIAGMARALQEQSGAQPRKRVVPLVVHGDASFSGQGIVAEALNIAGTRGYNVGGTVHVILNNQIGSTVSNLLDARSTLSSADIARAYDVPVLHVNGDEPERVVQAARIALEFRQRFHADIVVDLVGYRRHGHNGHDDPRVTQPAMQRGVRARGSVVQGYRERLLEDGAIAVGDVDALERRVLERQSLPIADIDATPAPAPGRGGPLSTRESPGVPFAQLRAHVRALCTRPEGMRLHDDLHALVRRWQDAAGSIDRRVDWCLAETLAYASLLAAGHHVRLTGLDIGRGSFFHRQCIWHDQDAPADGERLHVPLRGIGDGQGVFSVFDTPLSEEAVLGFEYGYSVMAGDTLVAWEAQFGDFVNNAQVIIDQFIASGEAKWGWRSGLAMLLPHGHEGGGPEHTSAYVGRFLGLCAERNLVVCMPSTSAQMFHLLRRQMTDGARKPLVAFTPKGQLYGDETTFSAWHEFEDGGFRTVLGEIGAAQAPAVERVVLASGKVAANLAAELAKRPDPRVALLRLEQLYPLPADEIRTRLAACPRLREVVWVQEEARNHGAWTALREPLEEAIAVRGTGIGLRCVARAASAASAGCRRSVHLAEQAGLVEAALREGL